jgi:hypothetical protein
VAKWFFKLITTFASHRVCIVFCFTKSFSLFGTLKTDKTVSVRTIAHIFKRNEIHFSNQIKAKILKMVLFYVTDHMDSLAHTLPFVIRSLKTRKFNKNLQYKSINHSFYYNTYPFLFPSLSTNIQWVLICYFVPDQLTPISHRIECSDSPMCLGSSLLTLFTAAPFLC